MTRIEKLANELEHEVYIDATHGKIAKANFLYGVAQGRIETIEKAVEWLKKANASLPSCYKAFEIDIEHFRKDMKDMEE